MPEQNKIIVPTVGRKVWYRASEDDLNGRGDSQMEANGSEPMDATVVAVWGTRLVNLAIFDIHGRLHARRSVLMLQPGDDVPLGGRYAEWMPFQIGQAKAAA